MSARRILFVDDDESILRTLTRYFERLGWQTFTATSGRAGIEAFRRVHPDVTVLDLGLPDISGLYVLEELHPQHPVVIVLTGDGEISHAVEAMRLGAENYLTKPIELSHLEVAAEKAAEKAALRRENRHLRSRHAPSLKRRITQSIITLILLGTAVGLGRLIGRGAPGDPEAALVRVPLDPMDTVTILEDAPFWPVPLTDPLVVGPYDVDSSSVGARRTLFPPNP